MIELGALKSTRWRHDGHLLLKKSRLKLKNQLQCGEGNTSLPNKLGYPPALVKGQDRLEKGKFSRCNIIMERNEILFGEGNGHPSRSVNNCFLPSSTHLNEQTKKHEFDNFGRFSFFCPTNIMLIQ